jgi:hypothetical protein
MVKMSALAILFLRISALSAVLPGRVKTGKSSFLNTRKGKDTGKDRGTVRILLLSRSRIFRHNLYAGITCIIVKYIIVREMNHVT